MSYNDLFDKAFIPVKFPVGEKPYRIAATFIESEVARVELRAIMLVTAKTLLLLAGITYARVVSPGKELGRVNIETDDEEFNAGSARLPLERRVGLGELDKWNISLQLVEK